MNTKLFGCLFLLAASSATVSAEEFRDPATVNPPFPRIGTCYGAGLSWKSWDEGKEWWSRVDLILGGGYDLHYDWDNPRWAKSRPRLEENLKHLREVNPHCLFLPYVDVVEGPDNPDIPQHWWDLRDGERWSGWPGFFRINTKLPEVLQFNLDRTRDDIMAHPLFDGVFYDCWDPDPWLVPKTAELRDGKAIAMVNCWNLPNHGFASTNGCLAEDELNRVVDGKVAFEDYLARYLRWCTESRAPRVTMLVCHPRQLHEDPWANRNRTREERLEQIRLAETSDPQMMRFGLTTTLMGDGYFGYDGGNGLSRGNWWWYPEYDAPLGYPKGSATRREDGIWQRDFDGGRVVVNGTAYDAVVDLPERVKDISTGRVGTRFTIPMFDGRILLPTTEAATAGDDVPPRLTRTPPPQPQAVQLDGGNVLLRAPDGLEIRFAPTGEPNHILWHGQPILTGGWPGIFVPPMHRFQIVRHEPCQIGEAAIEFRGTLEHEGKQIDYTATYAIAAETGWQTRLQFTIRHDLTLRMWRQYLTFPTGQYAGGTAESETGKVKLPETLGEGNLLPAAKQVVLSTDAFAVTVESSVPLGLVDHRKWGTNEFLLAGYPLNGEVKAGTTLAVEMRVAVRPLPAPAEAK
ncbi:MAG: putative glycoside hydrolase [Lentisphaeria bacterium]|jgi:hypothetical protein|nr:putative glycoside hydrolase [Lentisphaeria bacterium]